LLDRDLSLKQHNQIQQVRIKRNPTTDPTAIPTAAPADIESEEEELETTGQGAPTADVHVRQPESEDCPRLLLYVLEGQLDGYNEPDGQ